MNRHERVEAVAASRGDSKAATGEPVNALSGIIAGVLTKGEAMQLVSFSRFAVGERVAPTGRNLTAGAELPISVEQSAKFAAANAVKDAVQGS
ncbi:HU family DNA-binding protein [Paraburkholderia fungorum]|uniref:HU family DNA-binding protein n=1 Tax=Paraburkholderia fungorum TaxID=134537 RepID=UPI0038B75881